MTEQTPTVALPPPVVLRMSTVVFRDPTTSPRDRAAIQAWWESMGIPNQFAARLRAAEIEKS